MKRTSLVSLNRNAEKVFSKLNRFLIGADEAGRGPLCGPVVCAAVYARPCLQEFDGVVDSKSTKEEDREITYDALIASPDIVWGVSIVENTEIDTVNILQASLNGMSRAVMEVVGKLTAEDKLKVGGGKKRAAPLPTSPQESELAPLFSMDQCIALFDGNKVPKDMPMQVASVVKGDSSIFSIAAASIIAKVTRDRIMRDLDKKFPQYNISQHKGYPTAEHRGLLWQHGPCSIYRYSYKPVRDAATRHGLPIPHTYLDDKEVDIDLAERKGGVKDSKGIKMMKNKVVKKKIDKEEAMVKLESVSVEAGHGQRDREAKECVNEKKKKPESSSVDRAGSRGKAQAESVSVEGDSSRRRSLRSEAQTPTDGDDQPLRDVGVRRSKRTKTAE